MDIRNQTLYKGRWKISAGTEVLKNLFFKVFIVSATFLISSCVRCSPLMCYDAQKTIEILDPATNAIISEGPELIEENELTDFINQSTIFKPPVIKDDTGRGYEFVVLDGSDEISFVNFAQTTSDAGFGFMYSAGYATNICSWRLTKPDWVCARLW